MPLHQHLKPEYGLKRFGTQHVLRATECMGSAAFQQQQAVAVTRSQIEVMQNHQHGCALLDESASGLQRGVLMQWIEHRRGLIEQQHLSFPTGPELRQHTCQVHTLALDRKSVV